MFHSTHPDLYTIKIEYNYKNMRANKYQLHQQLFKKIYQPSRIPYKVRHWVDSNVNPNHEFYWENLSKQLKAIDLLEANQHKINWKQLSTNLNAIHLLKDNLDKIDGITNMVEIIRGE